MRTNKEARRLGNELEFFGLSIDIKPNFAAGLTELTFSVPKEVSLSKPAIGGGVSVKPFVFESDPGQEGEYIYWATQYWGRVFQLAARRPTGEAWLRDLDWYDDYQERQGKTVACFLSFLALAEEDDPQPFLKFAQNYGVLGIWPSFQTIWNGSRSFTVYREPLALWRRMAMRLKAMTQVGVKLASGQPGERKEWSCVVSRRRLSEYVLEDVPEGSNNSWSGKDKFLTEQFLPNVVMQRVVLVELLNDMFRHITVHASLRWTSEEFPSIALRTNCPMLEWDEARFRLVDKVAWLADSVEDMAEVDYRRRIGDPVSGTGVNVPSGPVAGDALAALKREIMDSMSMPLRTFPNPRYVDIRPSALYNVLVLHLAAMLSCPDGHLLCKRCHGPFLKKGRQRLCGECQRKSHQAAVKKCANKDK